jgi:hypothetical protein
VGCVLGASLLNDYVRVALEAGLTDLTVPQIDHGTKFASVLSSNQGSPEQRELRRLAGNALASIKLHGRKAK